MSRRKFRNKERRYRLLQEIDKEESIACPKPGINKVTSTQEKDLQFLLSKKLIRIIRVEIGSIFGSHIKRTRLVLTKTGKEVTNKYYKDMG